MHVKCNLFHNHGVALIFFLLKEISREGEKCSGSELGFNQCGSILILILKTK